MSDFFKKIKSIETEDDNLSPLKKTAHKIEDMPRALSTDNDKPAAKLRKRSSSDDLKEVFESRDDDTELTDSNLDDLPLPGFLSRGNKIKDPFTGEALETKTPQPIPPESEKLLFKLPKAAPSDTDPSESKSGTQDEVKKNKAENKFSPSPSLQRQSDLPAYDNLDVMPLSRYASSEDYVNPDKDDLSHFNFFKTGTFLAVFFWIVISSAVAYGYFDLGLTWKTLTPINLAGLVLLIIAPAFLIALSAYTFAKLAHLSQSAAQLDRTTRALMRPDETIIDKTTMMSHIIKNQIDTVDARLEQAQARMADLEGVIRVQSDALNGLRISIETSAHHITHTFQTERSEFESASTELDEKMNALIHMVSEHSATLSQLSKLAEQKITEARINTEGAAAKMNSASELVRQNTVEATASLKLGHQEIEHLGDMILKSSHELDSIYKNHAKDLALMIEQLRDEQENLGVSLEARLAKMREVAESAKTSAESLTLAGESGRNTVVALSEAARITEDALRTRFAEMEKMVEYSNNRAENINQMAARRVQNSLALTRKEIARIEADMQALQDRLNTQIEASLIPVMPPSKLPPAISDDKPSQNDAKIKPSTKVSRNPIRLLPVDEITHTDTDKNALPPHSDVTQDEITDPITEPDPRSISLEDIRPKRIHFTLDEDDMNTEFAHDLVFDDTENDDEALEIPESTPETVTETNPSTSPDIPLIREGEDLELDNSFFEKLAPAALTSPETQPAEPSDIPVSIDDHNDDAPLTPVASPPPHHTKQKWNWKSVLSGQFAEESASLDKTSPSTHISQSNEMQIIATLSGMGLSPGAIIDDGCLIEAANIRRSHGPTAMSHTVSNRLKDPVKHLRSVLEINPEFKSDMRAFTSQFQVRLDTVKNDKDSLRARLESESGRAFLLCDAALNG